MCLKLAVMIGSESDLPQCEEGMRYLLPLEEAGRIEFIVLIANSIHRNTEKTLENTQQLGEEFCVDRLIVGAGMANHLTGTVDAFLRYGLKNDRTVVYGVAFEGASPKDIEAAIISILKVPGTQVVFNEEDPTFLAACKRAVEDEAPKIELKPAKPTRQFLSIAAVLEAIDEINKKASKS